MVLPLLRGIAFTRGLREALPFFESIIAKNPAKTATAILREARDLGLSFRDTPAFQLVAQLKNNRNLLSKLKLTDFDDVPSDSELEVAVTPLRRNYAYVIGIEGFNPFSGSRQRRFVTVVSDTALSINEAFEAARDLPSGQPGSQILINENVFLDKALISPLALD